jgi:hypothetical protein
VLPPLLSVLHSAALASTPAGLHCFVPQCYEAAEEGLALVTLPATTAPTPVPTASVTVSGGLETVKSAGSSLNGSPTREESSRGASPTAAGGVSPRARGWSAYSGASSSKYSSAGGTDVTEGAETDGNVTPAGGSPPRASAQALQWQAELQQQQAQAAPQLSTAEARRRERWARVVAARSTLASSVCCRGLQQLAYFHEHCPGVRTLLRQPVSDGSGSSKSAPLAGVTMTGLVRSDAAKVSVIEHAALVLIQVRPACIHTATSYIYLCTPLASV